MKQINLENYSEFVKAVTSDESNNTDCMVDRINELNGTNGNVNMSLLLTSAVGLGSESGEFQEIVKKMLFQGKPLNSDTIFHMKRELGDIMWYWANACRAIGITPNEVIEENVNKLESRYPGGKFDVYYSENRKDDDL